MYTVWMTRQFLPQISILVLQIYQSGPAENINFYLIDYFF